MRWRWPAGPGATAFLGAEADGAVGSTSSSAEGMELRKGSSTCWLSSLFSRCATWVSAKHGWALEARSPLGFCLVPAWGDGPEEGEGGSFCIIAFILLTLCLLLVVLTCRNLPRSDNRGQRFSNMAKEMSSESLGIELPSLLA